MNEQNLTHFTSAQDREQAAINGRLGGIASGEAKRERKRLREDLAMLLSETTEDGEPYNEAVATAMIKKALEGNVSAFVAIRDTVDGKPTDTVMIAAKPDFSALDAAFEKIKFDEGEL